MQLRGLAIGALFLTLALAGCSDDKEGDGSDTTSDTGVPITYSNTPTRTSSSSNSTSASSTSTSTGPGNKAPTGSISAVVNGTSAAFNLTGSDPDGDAIVWDLTFGDGNATNGTSLPAAFAHNYTAAGNYTVNFTITDGTATATYNVTLNVTGAAGATTQDIDASWEAAYNPACFDGTIPHDAIPDSEGVNYASAAVEPGTIGKPFVAEFDSGAFVDYVRFVDADGATLLQVEAGGPALTWTATGTVPDGSATVVFFGCGGLPSEHVVYHAG